MTIFIASSNFMEIWLIGNCKQICGHACVSYSVEGRSHDRATSPGSKVTTQRCHSPPNSTTVIAKGVDR